MRNSRLTLLVFSAALVTGTVLAQDPSGAQQQQLQLQQQQQPANTAAVNNGAAQDQSSTGGATGQEMLDRMFLRKAFQGDFAEIKLAQLTLTKTENDDVKQFAKKMVDDHTMLLYKMRRLSAADGIAAERKLDKKEQAIYDQLNGLSGSDFDQAYITVMVKDHHKDLKDFQLEQANTTNPDLKAVVTAVTTIIQEHTTMVDALAQKNGISISAKM